MEINYFGSVVGVDGEPFLILLFFFSSYRYRKRKAINKRTKHDKMAANKYMIQRV